MAKGWKTISIPADLYDLYKDEWETNAHRYKLKYGIRSFTGFFRVKLWELFNDEIKGEVFGENPLINDALLKDIDGFVEIHHSGLRKCLKIKDVRMFIEDSLLFYLNFCQKIMDRLDAEN